MKEKITVDKAINRGHLIVNIPVFIALIGIPGLAIYLVNLKIIPGWGTLLGFVLGFAFAWVVWSFMITKWRIWAFENVRNVHELKKRAIQEKLIWEDGKWFEKTEIRTNSDKLKWKELQQKFEKKDFHQEDNSVPIETKIYYSKATNYFEMAIMLFCFGLGVYLISTSGDYFKGVFFIIAGGYFSIKEYKQATNNEPQIIISNKGIQTINTEFKEWSKVKREDVITEGSGKRTKNYLIYDFTGGDEKLEIDDYDINYDDLINLLRTYRIRSKKTTANNS